MVRAMRDLPAGSAESTYAHGVKTADAAPLLLAGPRGRDLCLAVTGVDSFEVISSTYLAEKRPDLRR